jgi:hypothetical protein
VALKRALAREQRGVPEQDFLVFPVGGTCWPAGEPKQ